MHGADRRGGLCLTGTEFQFEMVKIARTNWCDAVEENVNVLNATELDG